MKPNKKIPNPIKALFVFALCILSFGLSAQIQFEEVLPQNLNFIQASHGSVATADIDGDNDIDIVISGGFVNGETSTILYMNDGNGNFTENESVNLTGVSSSSISFADIDNDNDLDLLITGANSTNLYNASMFINDGLGNFVEDNGSSIAAVNRSSIAFADIDGDNDKDLLITGLTGPTSDYAISKLYLNDGLGNFSEIPGTGIIESWQGSVAFADIDNDNDSDLLITGSQTDAGRSAKLYENDGNGNFTEIIGTPFVEVSLSSVCFSDLDGDNDQDLIITGATIINNNEPSTKIYFNDGIGNFSEPISSPFVDVKRGTVITHDVDNDGDQDVFISGESGDQCEERVSILYKNEGDGVFIEVLASPFEGTRLNAASFADVNNDNSVDLILTGETCDLPRFSTIYINQTPNIFDCPDLNANIGSICDDGNPTTYNDVINAQCLCEGTSTFDCPELASNIGDDCDDGNPATQNETVQANCTCQESSDYPSPPGSGFTLNFDGINNYVLVPDNEELDLLSGWTLETWVKLGSSSGQHSLIEKFSSGDLGGYALRIQSNGVPIIYHISGGTANLVQGLEAIEINEWVHVAGTFDPENTTLKLYVNGVLQGTNSSAALPTVAVDLPLKLGARGNNEGTRLEGQMDEVRIWSSALSEEQIKGFMCQKNLNSHPESSSLVAYYRFDDLSTDGALKDLSGLDNHGIIIDLDPLNDWVLSGAPIGDISTYSYEPSSLSIIDGTIFTVDNFDGNPEGVHIYKVGEAPNDLTPPVGYDGLHTLEYFGVHIIGGSSPTYSMNYDYGANPNIPNSISQSLSVAFRDNNAAGQFEIIENQTYNYDDLNIQVQNQTSSEFILSSDEVDCIAQALNIGDPCNDGNPNTTNETVQPDCTCQEPNSLALYFDGSNDNISIPADPSTDFESGDFTVEFWMYLEDSNNQYGGIIGTFSTSSGGWALHTEYNTLSFIVGQSATSGSFDHVSSNFSPGNWIHVAGVRIDNVLHLYLDGELVSSGPSSRLLPNHDIMLGRRYINLSNYYESFKLDELRVWDFALSAQEINDNINCSLNGNESGLVRYYRFDQGQAGMDNTSESELESSDDNPISGSFSNFSLTGNISNFVVGTNLNCSSSSDFDCPVLNENIGAPCDDGDPNTTNETVQPDCTCQDPEPLALFFDGTDDFVQITQDETTDFNPENFTVEFWLLLADTLTQHGGIATSFDSFEGGWAFNTDYDEISFVYGADADFLGFDQASAPFPINNWVHIAGVKEFNTIRLYINGVLIDSAITEWPLTHHPIILGRRFADSSTNYESFKIDEFRVWNFARSESDINGQMNCQLNGTELGLVRYYRFNQGIPNGNNSSETSLLSSDANNLVDGSLMNFELNGTTSNFVNGIPFTSCSGMSEFDCPDLELDYGDACNDENANTNNDIVQADCTCQGTSIFDCPDLSANIGDACDDGDINTEDDMVLPGCICEGTPLPNLALSFDGEDDYVVVPSDNSTEFGINDFSVEFWIYLGETNSQGGIASTFHRNQGGWAFFTNFNTIQFAVGFDALSSSNYEVASATLTSGTWTHVAGVRENDEIRIYINGELADTESSFRDIPNNDLYIGRRYTNQSNFYEGFKLDEFRMWNYALGYAEINDILECPTEVESSGLVRYFQFNQGIAEGDNSSQTTLFSGIEESEDGELFDFSLSGGSSNFVDGAPFVDCSGNFDCPDLNANIGDPCDDGDPSTNDDIVLFNCQCAGTLNVECPDLNSNIGEICDDGNPNTENDLVQEDCTCEGESVFDCPELNANIGNGCDDGDPNTINDIVLEDCTCAGIQDFDCPDLNANIGDLCNDGDSDTNNDTVQPDCSCEGTIDFDCPDLSLNIGDPCDDGNPNTENDAITVNCTCAGISTVASISGTVVWSSDCGPRDLTMQFYEAGTNNLVHSSSTLMEADGSFELPSVPPGTYDIFLKINGTLQEELLNQEITNGTNSTDFGEVILGDLNGDNGINIVDFSVVNSAFGSAPGDPNYNPLSDMNCDDGVNIIDFSVLNAGFGLAGASPGTP